MQNVDKIAFLEKEIDLLLGWIKAIERRITLILPLSTTMLGALALLAPKPSEWLVWAGIFSAFAVFFLISSIVCAAISSFPRTDGPKGSLIFFGGIAKKEKEQYKSEIENLSEGKYIEDLIAQCHINAQIAEKKYSWIQKSMACLFFSSLPWSISVYFFYSGTN